MTVVEIPRDGWERPLIVPLDGGDPVPYVRVSTLAKTIEDKSGLISWKQRKTAEGLLRRPDLMTRLAGALAKGDPDIDKAAKRSVNAVCSEAAEAAGASSGASTGTGLHALTEAIDAGIMPEFVPEGIQPRLDAYRKATADLEPLDVETFVVNDKLTAAGTFDRLYRCPDGKVRVADLKTGKSEADYPLSTTIQIAIYANGSRYDPVTAERRPLHPDLDTSHGLLVHLPATGGCRVIELNLMLGWEAACIAAYVYAVRKWKADRLARAL